MTLEEYARQQQNVENSEQALPVRQKKTSLEIRQQEAEEAQKQAREVYAHYQDNIRQTEQLSTEILKGLQCGEPLAKLFLKAVRALTLCTNNKAEYGIIEHTLLTVYGLSLRDGEVMELSAEKIRERLDRLNVALKSVDNESERCRIQQAIQAHQKELDKLKKKHCL